MISFGMATGSRLPHDDQGTSKGPAEPIRLLRKYLPLSPAALLALGAMAACGGGDSVSTPAATDEEFQAAMEQAANPGAQQTSATPDDDDASSPRTPEPRAEPAEQQREPDAAGDRPADTRDDARAPVPGRLHIPQAATALGDAISAAEAVANAPAGLDVEAVSRSIVRVEPAELLDNDYSVVVFGSGSILDADGLILTSFYVIDPAIGYDVLLIAITNNIDQPPEERFTAEIVIADPTLDLAVLRLITGLDGDPVELGTLDPPVLPRGDPDEIRVKDRKR
jgi:hypothetical protein